MKILRALTVVEDHDPAREEYLRFVRAVLPSPTIHFSEDCSHAIFRILKGRFSPNLVFLTPTQDGNLNELFYCSIQALDELRDCSFFLLATKFGEGVVAHAHQFDVVPCLATVESADFWRGTIARAML